MDEKDILVLESLGYKINEIGAIVDKDNNFVEKVQHNNRVIQTHISSEEFENHKKKKNYLDNIDFKYDASKGGTLETQQNVAVAKEHLKEFKKNPLHTQLPFVEEDPIYKQAFEEIKKEDEEKGEFTFQHPKAMVDSLEQDTVYEDIQDLETKNSLKDIDARLKKIESLDADVDTILSDVLNEQKDPDRNIFEKGGDLLWDGIYSLAASFTPTGTGMDDKKLKEEYLKLKQEKKDLLIPVAEKKLENVNALLQQLEEEAKDVDYFSFDYDRYAYSIQQLENKQRNLEDFISGDNLDSNIFSINNALDWASMGLYDAYAKYTYVNAIRDKIDSGETLTKAEEAVFKSKALIDDVNKKNLQQNFWHEVTGGAGESAKFLGFGVGGRVVGKGLAKSVAKSSSKILTGTTGKIVGQGSSLLTQTALHPHTFKNAFEKYAGDFELRTNEDGSEEFLAGKRLYNTLLTENEQFKSSMEEQLAEAKASGNKDKVREIQKEIIKSDEYAKMLKEPEGYGDSFAYGYTEMLKENASELFGGRVYKALGLKKLEAAIGNNRLGKKLLGDKLLRPVNKLLGGTPTQKIIGSNTEEIFEEILVQATPTYGQSWDEYKKQVSELADINFYTKVAAQTLLMNKTFQAGGLANKYYNIQRLSKDEKSKRKEIAKLYDELGKKNLSQEQFNEVMMKAGEGNFSTQEYANTIQNLRSKGRNEEANNIEQNKVYKQALTAQKYGKLKEFRKSLNAAKFNPNLSPQTLANLEVSKTEVDGMIEDEGNYINSSEVINLKSTQRTTSKIKKDLEIEKSSLENETTSEQFEKIKKKFDNVDTLSLSDFRTNKNISEYIDTNFKSLPKELQRYVTIDNQQTDINSSLKQIEKTLDKVTSYDHQIKLEIEQDYYKYLDGLNKKVFNRNISAEQFNNLVDKIPSKKQKGISKQRLEEIHNQVFNTLQVDEVQNTPVENSKNNVQEEVQTQETQVETEKKVTESTSEFEQSPEVMSILEKLVLDQSEATNNIDSKENLTEEQNDEIDFLPSNGLINQFRDWGTKYRQDLESEPTFSEFFKDALTAVDNDKSLFNRSSIKTMGEAWESAGLGKSNWEQLYKENYSDLNTITQNIVNSIIKQDVVEGSSVTKEDINNIVEIQNISKVENTAGINPLTGEPVKFTPVSGKTTIISPKANYSALEYVNKQVVTEKDGKKIITYTKEDATEIPSMREDSFIDLKTLLHPEKNNPGDIWSVKISNESDWGDENLKVSVNDPITGEVKEFISFPEWIKRNQPNSNDNSFEKANIEKRRQEEIGTKESRSFTDSQGYTWTVTLSKNKDGKLTRVRREKNGEIIGQYENKYSVDLSDSKIYEVENIDNYEYSNVKQVEVKGKRTDKINAKYDAELDALKETKMSLEDFQKTEEFINKVPIYYIDKEGNKVSFVADTDWYNPLSVRDTSKEEGEFVDLNNITDNHKKLIEKGKENTKALRKSINEGNIKEVQIVSKDGSPLIKLPQQDKNGNPILPKTLKEASPDSKVVFFKGDYFVNLDGTPLDLSNIEITNIDTLRSQSAKNSINSTYYLSPINKTDSKQRFIALGVLRKNESNQEKAKSEDIQTAKWILAANSVLQKGKPLYGLTLQDANSIQAQMKQEVGLDIINFDNAINLVNSLIAIQKGNKKYTANDRNIPLKDNKTGYFIDALFYGDYTPVQNTNLSNGKSFGTSIQKNDTGFTVSKIGENYEDFLKERLTTNIVSYNMGTEDSPAYTSSIQPIIKVEPIESTTEDTIKDIPFNSSTDVDSQIDDALDFLGSINGLDIDLNSDYLLPTLEEVDSIRDSLNTIDGITLEQQQDVINFVLSNISSKYKESKELSIKDFNKDVKEQFNAYFSQLKTKLESIENNLSSLLTENPEKEKLKDTIATVKANISNVNTVISNYDQFFTKSYLEGMRKGFIPSRIKTNNDLQDEIKEHFTEEMYEKDYSKSSNEIIHKDKVSKKLRRLFSTISNGEKGFLGVPKHDSYDTMYNTISTILTSPLPASPSFDEMLSRLDNYIETYPWLKKLNKELRNAEADTKNAFVSNMYKYAAKAKFVAFTDQIDGMDSRVWFSNANNIKQKIKESWNNNFKRSTLTNGATINTEKLSKLYDQWKSWGDAKDTQSDETLRTWLNDFGIKFSDNTWEDLKNGKYITGKGAKARPLSFKDLFFDTSKRGDRLFSNLANYALQHKNSKQGELDYIQNNKLHPFDDMGDIFKSLIDMESKHNSDLINITRRDGDKTVSEIIFPTFFLNSVDKLVKSAQSTDKTYIDSLKKLSFSNNSYILDLLENTPEFSNIFEYGETGLMSMKRLYKKNPSFAKVDQLSPVDYMFHQRSLFQDMRTESLKVDKFGFPLRVSTVSTPTNSDKGRMMLLKTAVFNLYNSPNAFIKNEQDYDFSSELKELLYDQLVLPELNRIVNHKDTNIKDYDKGAKRFNLIPIINTIVGPSNISAIEYLKSNRDLNLFKENYGEAITSYLEQSIKNEADSNIKIIEKFKRQEGNNEVDFFNSKKYLDQKKNVNVDEKIKLAEYDYVINSMISNMNTMQLISGDPAMYYKSKSNGTSIDTSEQVQVSRDLGTNLGKRLALMIAPGVVLSNSKDEKYLQLFLQDSEEVAQNAEEIIKWHYGKDSLKEEFNDKTYQEHINDLRNKSISDSDLKQLKLRFSSVKDFLEIESTDAQEYTTLKEHLRVLEGLGRLSLDKKKDIISKVYKKKQPLSKEEIQLVLQPLKPVYTGEVIDKEQDVKRIMYIKSSSFPLIPDLVNGTKLQSLMNKMEDLEIKHGTTVRASYQSANKVGAMNNPINPFNLEDLNKLDELNTNTGIPNNALQLDRINFKIQQDVPFKSDLQNEDKVSMGTQIFKLLFGDGIDNLSNFELDGQKINGKDLKQEFFKSFSNIVNIQKDTLLEELGLDDDFESSDKLKTAQKLQKLLVAEAEERGFSENDIKALEIQKKTIKGKEVYHFKLPLWFSGNSNKFESMLNAIINNRMFKQKLPGNSFVVGSEAGLQIDSNIEKAGNNIIYVGDYKGAELKGNEVLAPSKFKLDGKLIDLSIKEEGRFKYLIEKEGDLHLNEEMIDPKLLENFVFRTPTSSHGSASSIKIVGLIPSVMGDLMITPKNFVTQMGQDFDIDKLTSYQYHTLVFPDGKIKVLNEANREQYVNEIVEKLKDLQSQLKAEKSFGSSTDKLINSVFPGLDIDSEFIKRDLQQDISDLKVKINKDFDLKIAQNRFIDIHNSVYKNKNSKVQQKINKVLSMDFAESQAEAIEKLNNTNTSGDFNILSSKYQMDKMIAGSTGSLAIGIYAKGVTFNSLAQQAENPIQLTFVDEEGVQRPKSINIGKLSSNGLFGLEKAIGKEKSNAIETSLLRNITQVQDERVNTGTDNEKAQILGRVGITSLDAVAVDNLLSLLGIDAEINQIKEQDYDASNPFHKTAIVDNKKVYYTEYSIPYLLHSQPIVKEYFNRVKNGNAIIEEFSGNIENTVLEDLLGESNLDINFRESFTGENLVNEIKGNNYSTEFQKQILYLYKDLITDAKKLKDLQEITDMSNLGKSMWDLKDKIEKFKAIKNNTDFLNADTSLLGEFGPEASEINLGDGKFFDPKTNQGVMIGNAISLGRNLFFDYFPYYDNYIDTKISEIVESSGFKGNPIRLKETIFQEMKKYITSATRNNLFLDTPYNERKNIFIDDNSNKSLSSYIAESFNNTDSSYKKGLDLVKNNALLSFMSYEKGEQGKPSLIKFDNSQIANVSEEHFYNAFKELLIQDVPLPSKNGQDYSTRKLAQEMVAYSYLSGGIVSQAIEFHKYIPIEYYDELFNTDIGVNVTRMLQNYDTLVTNWGDKQRLLNFNTQFFQNNPEFAQQLPKKFRDDYVQISGSKLSINTEIEYPSYLSIKNSTKSKLKQDKWSLYKNIGENQYEKISVLGEFGMSEYDYDSTNLNSILKSDKNLKPSIVQTIKNNPSILNNNFTIESGQNPKEVLENIKDSNISYNPQLSSIAATLLDIFKEDTLNSKLTIINNPNEKFRGRHNNGEIIINKANPSRLEETFIHEFIHSVTVGNLKPYYNENWSELINGTEIPSEVRNLNVLFKDFKDSIQKEFPTEYQEFVNKYDKFKNKEEGIAFSDRELSLFYPTINVKEFLAVSLSNNQDLIKETSKIPYKKSGLTIREKFIEILNELLNKISGVNNNLAQQILNTSFSTVESIKKSNVNQEITGDKIDNLIDTIKTDSNLTNTESIEIANKDYSDLPDNIKRCK